jgi:hypothetical protein
MEAKPNGTKHHIGCNRAGSGLKAWWDENRIPLEMLLILAGSIALLAWHPDWNVSWILLSFVTAFGVQRMLVFMGAPPDSLWKLLLIVAVVLVVLATVASRGHHNTHILWSAAGFFVGAWSGREQERRERTMR